MQGLLPYWNVNVPLERQTAKCPDFLLNLSEKDIGILSTADEDYHRQSWPEVQELVSESLCTSCYSINRKRSPPR
jgi:hypothetical protein